MQLAVGRPVWPIVLAVACAAFQGRHCLGAGGYSWPLLLCQGLLFCIVKVLPTCCKQQCTFSSLCPTALFRSMISCRQEVFQNRSNGVMFGMHHLMSMQLRRRAFPICHYHVHMPAAPSHSKRHPTAGAAPLCQRGPRPAPGEVETSEMVPGPVLSPLKCRRNVHSSMMRTVGRQVA